MERKGQLGTAGPESIEALQEQWQRFLRRTSQEHSGTLEESACCVPQCKTLFGRDRDLFFGSRLDLGPEPAILVQPTRVVQGVGQAERVADLAGQLKHLSVDLQSLVRVAQVPQRNRQVGAAGDAGIVARVDCPKLGALPVVVLGHRRREAVAGAGEIRTIEHRLTRHEQRFHHDAGVVELAGKLHPLGGQVHAQAEIAAYGMPLPDTENDRKQLERLPHPLTQLMRRRKTGPTSGAA